MNKYGNNKLVTRRTALITGLTSLGSLLVGGCTKPLPPTYGNILRMGDVLTYTAHRALLPGQSLVKEYRSSDISSFPATGTTNPGDPARTYRVSEAYARMLKNNFSDYSLSVEGSVDRPGKYTLSDIQTFPARKQTTRHTCEEGWTAIGEWIGTPLGLVLNSAGIRPSARFVNFYTYDGWIDSIDLMDAFHPQTILAYGMNGKNLLVPHGAPLRLRVETQVGYKSMKYLERIVVTDEFMDLGDSGWAWYVGM